MKRVWLSLVLTCVLLRTGAGAEDTWSKAKSYFERAVTAYANEDWSSAEGNLLNSYKLARYPITAYFLACTYVQMDRRDNAARYVHLASTGDPPLGDSYRRSTNLILLWANKKISREDILFTMDAKMDSNAAVVPPTISAFPKQPTNPAIAIWAPKATPSSSVTNDFTFPGAGTPNQNDTIGDFCCTGETAVVRDESGTAVGYIYFHGFTGGVNLDSGSAAQTFSVLVSGVTDLSKPDSVRARQEVIFSAPELVIGTSKSTQAGALEFTVTILDASFTDSQHSRYRLGSVKVQVSARKIAQ